MENRNQYQNRGRQAYQGNNKGRPHQSRKPQQRNEEFFQRPEMSCLALKMILTVLMYCKEKNLTVMHYCVFNNFVLATMAGSKVLPKDVIQQLSPTLGKYGYKVIRLDGSRYALLRMPQVDSHWTKLGSGRTAKLPNDYRVLSNMLDELRGVKAE